MKKIFIGFFTFSFGLLLVMQNAFADLVDPRIHSTRNSDPSMLYILGVLVAVIAIISFAIILWIKKKNNVNK